MIARALPEYAVGVNRLIDLGWLETRRTDGCGPQVRIKPS